MEFFCSKLPILLLPLAVPLFFPSDNILLLLIVLALIALSSWLWIYPIVVLRSLYILIVLLIVPLPLLLMIIRRDRLLLEVLLVAPSILPILRRNRMLLLILPLHRLLLLLLTRSILCLITSSNCSSFLEFFLLLLATRLRIGVAVRILLPLIQSLVFSVGMTFEIPHILVNVDSFEAVLLKLSQETLHNLGEFREILLDVGLILLVLPLNVHKELLEMMRIIHDKLVYNGFMKVDTWKLIGITFYDHCSHGCEVSGYLSCTSLHNEKIFCLYFMKEPCISFYIRYQRFESNRDVVGFLHLMRPDKSRRLSPIAILILVVTSCSNEQAGVSTRTPLHRTSFSHNCFVLFPEH